MLDSELYKSCRWRSGVLLKIAVDIVFGIFRLMASIAEDSLYISKGLSGERYLISCVYDLPRMTCVILAIVSQKSEWL